MRRFFHPEIEPGQKVEGKDYQGRSCTHRKPTQKEKDKKKVRNEFIRPIQRLRDDVRDPEQVIHHNFPDSNDGNPDHDPNPNPDRLLFHPDLKPGQEAKGKDYLGRRSTHRKPTQEEKDKKEGRNVCVRPRQRHPNDIRGPKQVNPNNDPNAIADSGHNTRRGSRHDSRRPNPPGFASSTLPNEAQRTQRASSRRSHQTFSAHGNDRRPNPEYVYPPQGPEQVNHHPDNDSNPDADSGHNARRGSRFSNPPSVASDIRPNEAGAQRASNRRGHQNAPAHGNDRRSDNGSRLADFENLHIGDSNTLPSNHRRRAPPSEGYFPHEDSTTLVPSEGYSRSRRR